MTSVPDDGGAPPDRVSAPAGAGSAPGDPVPVDAAPVPPGLAGATTTTDRASAELLAALVAAPLAVLVFDRAGRDPRTVLPRRGRVPLAALAAGLAGCGGLLLDAWWDSLLVAVLGPLLCWGGIVLGGRWYDRRAPELLQEVAQFR